MKALFWRSARFLYGLPDSEIGFCDLVVPLGYGLTIDDELPDATKKTVLEAIRVAEKHKARIVWASSNYFFPGCERVENEKKLALFGPEFSMSPILIGSGITNSVSEAREIKIACQKASLFPKDIVVVCDWPHARSTRLIWRKVFPESNILIRNVEGHWDETHRATLQKSQERWLLACLLRHVALITLGHERVSRIQHPTDHS
ncbi:MAG: hypothetical protein WCT19_00645 [Candidatus Paceibacterota bacterium]|jgi:hypothetical protein